VKPLLAFSTEMISTKHSWVCALLAVHLLSISSALGAGSSVILSMSITPILTVGISAFIASVSPCIV